MNTPVSTAFEKVASAATHSLRTLFARLQLSGASDNGVDALEDYLSTATSLHQLEDMQRRWDHNHSGQHSFGWH